MLRFQSLDFTSLNFLPPALHRMAETENEIKQLERDARALAYYHMQIKRGTLGRTPGYQVV